MGAPEEEQLGAQNTPLGDHFFAYNVESRNYTARVTENIRVYCGPRVSRVFRVKIPTVRKKFRNRLIMVCSLAFFFFL